MFVFGVMLLTAVNADIYIQDAGEEYLPMENPDLFEGDIIGIDNIDDKNAVPLLQKRWSENIVPYEIDENLIKYENIITRAMDDYHRNTCIRFKPRTTENNHIYIFPGRGCYSNVGMIGGKQEVSLGIGCIFVGTIVHELGHAIGFFHEQNRSDRDEYLTIYYNNIQKGLENQFKLLKPNENILFDTFDYNSIMIYGNHAFSKSKTKKFPTMVAKNGQPLTNPSSKSGLSESDIKRVNKMYNC